MSEEKKDFVVKEIAENFPRMVRTLSRQRTKPLLPPRKKNRPPLQPEKTGRLKPQKHRPPMELINNHRCLRLILQPSLFP